MKVCHTSHRSRIIQFSLPRVSQPISLVLIAVSLLVGICIPGFYDWSGQQQSRSSPVIAPIAIGLLLGWVAICFVVGFLAWEAPSVAAPRTDRLQFPMRAILILTTVIAVAAAVLRSNPPIILSAGIFVCVMAYCTGLLITRPELRRRLFTLLACMYLPFAWLLSYEHGSADAWFHNLFLVTLLPSVLLTLSIASLFGQHPDGLLWLGSVLTSCQILVGLLWFCRGERLSIGYNSLCLLLSTYGSFIVNALMRM